MKYYNNGGSISVFSTENEMLKMFHQGLEEIEDLEFFIQSMKSNKDHEDQIKEIENRLTELDLLSLRPLRAIEAGSATQYDHDKLVELDAESDILRNELRGLLV